MYLAKDQIFYECKNPEIENLNKFKGNKFIAGLIKIKNKFNANINRLIPAPESGLLSGLILGGSNQLSKEIQNNFSRTGMTHIVAVSGYNVTIIAQYLLLLGIFLGLWRPQAFWFAATGIILFVILTGLSASAVRAGVMGILLIWAMKNGRLANAENAILFSAVVMLLVNPLLLRWDIGFQLSFLATIGIVFLYPLFENYFIKNHKVMGLGELIFLTISAQIFVLPIIIFNFKTLSLISLLANILILPIIPITMLLGFLAAIFGFIFTPLATIFAWLAFLPLKYETLTINYLASLKYASIEVEMSWWGVVIWYIILLGVIYFFQRSKTKKTVILNLFQDLKICKK
jgi:competence protein ComEC